MSEVTQPLKAYATNTLKVSPALGAALAFLGVEGSVPLLHGSQGCTAFALVLLVRHFREAIPLQTTAMSELTTILGGADNVEQAIETLRTRSSPRLIGLCSTALTETRDDDILRELRQMKARHDEWQDLDVVAVATPDWAGSLEDGWARATHALISELVPAGGAARTRRQINLLPGAHLTPADVDAARELIESFGLRPVVLPDLSRSLDGHVPNDYVGTSLGGTRIHDIAAMGRSLLTLAIGRQMQPAAQTLHSRTGVPFRLLDSLTGLDAVDALIATLIEATQVKPPPAVQRARSRLIDAMLDAQFYFTGRRIGLAGECDQVASLAALVQGMGARVEVAVVASGGRDLSRIDADQALVGDLDDFAKLAGSCDLLIANSHAARLAEELGVPLLRAGFPVFDRLGAAQVCWSGYDGTRSLVFRIANLLLEHDHKSCPLRALAARKGEGVGNAPSEGDWR